MAAEKGCCKR